MSIVRKAKTTGSVIYWLMNGAFISGVIFFMSGEANHWLDWKSHMLVIHTDPSRQIMDPSLKLTAEDFKQIDCLARNNYFEAATQGELGMKATGDVVLNRMRSGLYPDGVCQVIYQKVKGVCQFSWYCEHKDHTPHDPARWQMANEVAYNQYVYSKLMPDVTAGALFYHADYVHPTKGVWARLRPGIQIGAHIFYKPDPGYAHARHASSHWHVTAHTIKHKGEIASISSLPMRQSADVPVSAAP